MKGIKAFVVITMAAVMTCGISDGLRGSSAPQNRAAKPDLRAVLRADNTLWKNGKPLRLTFYIVNRSRESAIIDGRMKWPGNLNVVVRLPDGRKKDIRTRMVKLALAAEEDMITLQPGTLYGTEIVIQPGLSHLIDEMRSLKSGRYELWVNFSSPGDYARRNKLSLRSNSVAVTVK